MSDNKNLETVQEETTEIVAAEKSSFTVCKLYPHFQETARDHGEEI